MVMKIGCAVDKKGIGGMGCDDDDAGDDGGDGGGYSSALLLLPTRTETK